MNVIKIDIHNKKEDEFFFHGCYKLVLFNKRDIARTINTDSIIDDFKDFKKH